MLREVAIMTALERQEFENALRELAVAGIRVEEYVDIFDKRPPKKSKIWADFHNALSAANTLLGGELENASCL